MYVLRIFSGCIRFNISKAIRQTFISDIKLIIFFMNFRYMIDCFRPTNCSVRVRSIQIINVNLKIMVEHNPHPGFAYLIEPKELKKLIIIIIRSRIQHIPIAHLVFFWILCWKQSYIFLGSCYKIWFDIRHLAQFFLYSARHFVYHKWLYSSFK